jgi:hypothetical protein
MTDVSPTTTASTTTTTTGATAATMTVAQAQLAAAQAVQTAAANAATLALLDPLAFLAGPTWAGYVTALQAQLPSIMAADYTKGQRVMRLIQIMTSDGAALASAYTKAGGATPTA